MLLTMQRRLFKIESFGPISSVSEIAVNPMNLTVPWVERNLFGGNQTGKVISHKVERIAK